MTVPRLLVLCRQGRRVYGAGQILKWAIMDYTKDHRKSCRMMRATQVAFCAVWHGGHA